MKKIIKIILGVVVFIFAVQIYSSSKYQIKVRTLEEGETAGINPTTESLDFGDLPKGVTSVRKISIQNNGNFKIWVSVMKFGKISSLINTSEDNFTLNPGDSRELSFQLRMPASADKNSYSGWVLIMKTPYKK